MRQEHTGRTLFLKVQFRKMLPRFLGRTVGGVDPADYPFTTLTMSASPETWLPLIERLICDGERPCSIALDTEDFQFFTPHQDFDFDTI